MAKALYSVKSRLAWIQTLKTVPWPSHSFGIHDLGLEKLSRQCSVMTGTRYFGNGQIEIASSSQRLSFVEDRIRKVKCLSDFQ